MDATHSTYIENSKQEEMHKFLPSRIQVESEYAQFDVALAKFLKSNNAAILFRKICAWVNHARLRNSFSEHPKYGKYWVYLTIQKVEEEINLSRKEQDNAFAILEAHGLVEKKVWGLPPIRYFRVNRKAYDEIYQKLDENFKKELLICPEESKNDYYFAPKGQKNLSLSDKIVIYSEPSKETKEKIPEPEKIHYRDTVSLTQEEHAKLLELHGQEKLDAMLNILDSYKSSQGKTYKSDYGAMKRGGWVEETFNQRKSGNNGGKLSNQSYAENIMKTYNHRSEYVEIELSVQGISFIPLKGQMAPKSISFSDHGFKDQVDSLIRKYGITKK